MRGDPSPPRKLARTRLLANHLNDTKIPGPQYCSRANEIWMVQSIEHLRATPEGSSFPIRNLGVLHPAKSVPKSPGCRQAFLKPLAILAPGCSFA
jgi:hypothetical protein